ncbi:transposase [Methylobacterium terricola]|uniref:Transposase n=1 Tax=Methylobacterium terricola TaxID=2583531 RepID=A0A5C4L7B4_9HYPH|nr:transposase [Methylobacterium terricola]TNC06406.1 transposase [Methylobacterium terricola]
MARPLLPDDLWTVIGPLLPPHPPRPKGGRPRRDDRAALTGILFVPRSGIPWEMLPAEMNCGCGMSCRRRRPDKLHADKAYDARVRRQACRARGIRPRIARRGIERSDRLGRHRWVVERSHAWFNRARRLPIRYERRADTDGAFTLRQASLITLHQIERFC